MKGIVLRPVLKVNDDEMRSSRDLLYIILHQIPTKRFSKISLIGILRDGTPGTAPASTMFTPPHIDKT